MRWTWEAFPWGGNVAAGVENSHDVLKWRDWSSSWIWMSFKHEWWRTSAVTIQSSLTIGFQHPVIVVHKQLQQQTYKASISVVYGCDLRSFTSKCDGSLQNESIIKSIEMSAQYDSIFQKEDAILPKSQRSGYWLLLSLWFQGFTRGSIFRDFFLGISLREKLREWLEGFSFRDKMQSLIASFITYKRKIQRLHLI